jgi:NADH-quinone oxidoreductase subunit J
MEWAVFVPLAALALGTGVLVIALRNPIYCALALIGTLFALSGLFLVLQAQFIAMIQVIIYAGAIMVLFLFVIMLLDVGREPPPWLRQGRPRLLASLALGALLVVEMGMALRLPVAEEARGPFTPDLIDAIGNTQLIGRLLFTEYLVPFEVTSIILLIAMIGAMVLARRQQG